MLAFLKKRPRRAEPPEIDIPRYPPFARGLPAVSEQQLLTTQTELVEKLRGAIGISRGDYERLVMPVIQRYAAYVHLLPASEAHHHRGAGGLLHHGLEVAFLAARSAEDVLFEPQATPRMRRELEPRWRLATCLAGLIHDVGKPVSDLTVTDRPGEKRWSPYTDNLADWAKRESIDRYFLHWQPGRHRRHEQFSVLVVERVLTREVVDWLSVYSPEILSSLLSAVAKMETDTSRIAQLIRSADNISVSRDMKRLREPFEESLGVPVERYIVDAMRQLITRGDWTINQRRSRGWVFHDGFYVCWNAAVEDIRRVLERDGVAGVPRDADSMADILIDRDIAHPRKTESATYRYWPMRPEFFGDSDPHRLMMLRLTPETFFNEPPSPIGAQIIEQRLSNAEKKGQVGQSEAENDTTSSRPAPAACPETHESAKGKKQSTPRLPATAQDDKPPSEPQEPATSAPIFDKGDAAEARSHAAEPEPSPAALPEMDVYEEWAVQAGERDASEVAPEPETNVETPTRESARETQSKRQTKKASASDAGAQQANLPFELDIGAATSLLVELRDKGSWEEHLFERSGATLIAYPEGARLLGEPLEIQQALADAGALMMDPRRPMLKVREVEGIRGLVLRADIVAQLWPNRDCPAEPVQADIPPEGTTKRDAKQKPGPQKTTTQNSYKPQSSPKKPRTSPTTQASNKTSDMQPHVLQLIETIRGRDAGIPGGIVELDGYLGVSQVVIAWFAKTRVKTSISVNKFRQALMKEPAVTITPERLMVKEQSNG